MISKGFFKFLDKISQERDLPKEEVVEAFTKGLIAGCKKNNRVKSCRVHLKENKNEVLLYKQFIVVDETNANTINLKEWTPISLEEAQKIKLHAKVGQVLEIKVNPKDFNLYAIKEFKNQFNEELTKRKRESVYQFFKQQEGKLISAKVISENEKFYNLELEKEIATLLLKKETSGNNLPHIGERIQVFLLEVRKTSKWPKIFVSHNHVGLVVKVFEENIPEIQEGIVKIMTIARISGERTKIGLVSYDPQVDPIGSCIGENSDRIRNIIKILKGEKIDLFRWSEDEKELISNALRPAQCIDVIIKNDRNKHALAIIPDDQFSLAIGKLGKNVKLAAEVTKWNIDIKTLSHAKKEGII
ncbi:Transcription elongation factor [Candidatus Phytoplasma australiense]|uniref:Transcription termination/antitermination protein NusA n=2 Tax=Phytoplasma australiense TaxID=59748 RepID=B1VAG7_PHYAS|nr:transcription termination factor NusA [Candidatus Phytoplasma australiense]AGL90332.1 Transcription elongation protein nusA [Strawberry lethal yellows phytoplasma (CPA) str. NZSb11]CAM11940.1 Transcription elongation factor [Candidatus Phytoplasma australiense]